MDIAGWHTVVIPSFWYRKIHFGFVLLFGNHFNPSCCYTQVILCKVKVNPCQLRYVHSCLELVIPIPVMTMAATALIRSQWLLNLLPDQAWTASLAAMLAHFFGMLGYQGGSYGCPCSGICVVQGRVYTRIVFKAPSWKRSLRSLSAEQLCPDGDKLNRFGSVLMPCLVYTSPVEISPLIPKPPQYALSQWFLSLLTN